MEYGPKTDGGLNSCKKKHKQFGSQVVYISIIQRNKSQYEITEWPEVLLLSLTVTSLQSFKHSSD
jgi:hypothetical protein